MAPSLLKPEQVAERLGMSMSWVYGNKHQIGYVQMGSAVRFEECAVQGYAESCKRGPHNEERKWESQSDTEKTATNGLLRKRTTVSDINERLQATRRVKSKHVSTQRQEKQR